MKRLLSYLKPHKTAMVLVTFLVILITALELYKPIIIGDAIDGYIEGYGVPYEVVPKGSEGAVLYDGVWLRKVTEDKVEQDGSYYQIFLYKDNYYMRKDVSGAACEAIQEADAEMLASYTEAAEKLSRTELVGLRKTDFSGVCRAAVIYLVVLLSIFVCNMVQTWVLQKTGQDIIYAMREEVFSHIHSLSLSFLIKPRLESW